MKLLTLAVNDVENVNAEYDFTVGRINAPDDAIKFLEYALFGNAALFSGKITLTAEYGGAGYVIARDFAADTTIFKDGVALDEKHAGEVIEKIAALKHKQWKENVAGLNEEEFVADVASYIKKQLAELGFDGEELEKRWDLYYKDHSLYVSKVEAYDELVDDSYIAITAEKKATLEELKQKLEAVDVIRRSAEEKGLVIALKNNLSDRKEKLLAEESAVEEKESILASDDALRAKIAGLNEVVETKAKIAELGDELDAVVAELEKLDAELVAAEQKTLAKGEEAAEHADRATGLRDSFNDILYANLDDKELTAAVLKKTEGVAATATEDKLPAVTEELKKNHLSYRKRRAIREGVAFENSFDNSEVRISDLTEKIKQNTALLEQMREELRANEELLPADTDETAGDREDGLSLHEAKVVGAALEREITDAEEKIRKLLKERKALLEDMNALKKAKIAQEEYVKRCKQKAVYLNDCLIDLKSKLAFETDAEDAEAGGYCPVCSGRIYVKQSFKEELDRTRAGMTTLTADIKEHDEVLAEGLEKLSQINARLSRLNERNAHMTQDINALSAEVADKQKQLTDILAAHGVKTLPDLERRFAAFSAIGGDEEAIKAHIAFVRENIEAVAATLEEDKKTLGEEEARYEAMKKDYDEAIRPELDGKQALNCLEEIIDNERREDELIAEISGDIVLGDRTFSADNGSADMYVNVTAEIFADVMAEIKKSDNMRMTAEEELAQERKALVEKQAEFNRGISRADEIKAGMEELQASIPTILDRIGCAEEDVDRIDEIGKELLADEKRNALVEETEKYRADINALDIQIATLEGYNADDFDKADYSELLNAVEKADKEYNKAATRLAVSEAAKDLAYENASVCGVLTHKMDELKKITDGEVMEVALPVLNGVFEQAEQQIEARPDGLEIAFYDRKKGKRLSLSDIDADAFKVAVGCAQNYIMSLVAGEQTTRFAVIDGKNGGLVEVAEGYGVIVL